MPVAESAWFVQRATYVEIVVVGQPGETGTAMSAALARLDTPAQIALGAQARRSIRQHCLDCTVSAQKRH